MAEKRWMTLGDADDASGGGAAAAAASPAG